MKRKPKDIKIDPALTQQMTSAERERQRAMEGAGLIFAEWRKRFTSRRRTEAEVAESLEELRTTFRRRVKHPEVLAQMIELTEVVLARWKLATDADAAHLAAATAATELAPGILGSANAGDAPGFAPGRTRLTKPSRPGGGRQGGTTNPADN